MYSIVLFSLIYIYLYCIVSVKGKKVENIITFSHKHPFTGGILHSFNQSLHIQTHTYSPPAASSR